MRPGIKRLRTRAGRMILFSGFKMQRDWILERNKETNKQYRQYGEKFSHLYNYSEEFIY
jgi:hypothetical protein